MAYLEMSQVHKRFGGVVALDGASLSGERGEIHALVGPNGSGKSTLNKTLTGVVEPDRATITLDGEEVAFASPLEAQARGIAAVYQELSLVTQLTVTENVTLGIEPTRRLRFLDDDRQRARARDVMTRFAPAFGGDLPLDTPVGRLSSGEQQIVEICKAIAREPRVLILDESTASLRQAQVEVLFEVARDLREEGVLLIFTSHRLDEVFDLCDQATVLRGGTTVGTVALAETDESALVEMMLGQELAAPRAATDEEQAVADTERPVLSVRGLSTDVLHDVSFEVRAGEILGLGGLQGQGQTELLAALFGSGRAPGGQVLLDGRKLRLRHPRHAVRAGIALIPGDRSREGLFEARPILENLAVPSMDRRARGGLLRSRSETAAATDAVERLSIKFGAFGDRVSTLSGGNQQKIVVGKWLLTQPRAVLMDDPMKGIDVSAKAELYEIMRDLAREGVGVVFNSSDDIELVDLADRVIVLYEGRIVDELAGDDLTEDRLLAASMRVEEVAD